MDQKAKWGIIRRERAPLNSAKYFLDETLISARLAKGLIFNNCTNWREIKEIDEKKLLRTINFKKASLAELKEVCLLKGIELIAPVLKVHSWRKIEYRPKDCESL